MNEPPVASTSGPTVQKLLLWWAMFASLAAAFFGFLALFLYLDSREQVGQSPAQPAEAAKASPSLPAQTYTSQGFDLLFNKHQIASALSTFETCLREYPDCADAHHGLAIAQRDAGEPAKAMHGHDRAIELAPNRGDFYWEKGVTCQRLKDHDTAIAAFERGLDPNNRGGPGFARGNLHIGLAQSYRAKGDLQKALDHNNQAIGLNARSDWFYRERGFTYQALGDREKAQADFDQARAVKNKER